MRLFKKAFCGLLSAAFLFSCMSVSGVALTPKLSINSETYVVVDAKTGQVLIEKGMNKKRAPASITKILTCALALEREDNLDKPVTMTREVIYSIPPNTTHIALQEGETASLKDMLLGTMLISANDAANGVALGVCGNLEDFVSLMNQKVGQIGLKNTRFNNPHGLDDPNHYTTAYDMAMITKYALTVPGFRELFGTLEYDFPVTNKKSRDYTFYNQDAMLFDVNSVYYEGVEGGKLGYTDNAKHTIVTLAKRGDMELICVAMGSSLRNDKYKDTEALLDYCFERYQPITLYGRELEEFFVPIGSRTDPTATASIRQREDFSLLVPLGVKKSDLTFTYNIDDLYRKENEVTPTFSVWLNDQLLQEIPMDFEITAPQAVMKPNQGGQTGIALSSMQKRFTDFMILMLKCLGVLLGVGILTLLITRAFIRTYYRRQHKKRHAIRTGGARSVRAGSSRRTEQATVPALRVITNAHPTVTPHPRSRAVENISKNERYM